MDQNLIYFLIIMAMLWRIGSKLEDIEQDVIAIDKRVNPMDDLPPDP